MGWIGLHQLQIMHAGYVSCLVVYLVVVASWGIEIIIL
jgi:hypothetical protein